MFFFRTESKSSHAICLLSNNSEEALLILISERMPAIEISKSLQYIKKILRLKFQIKYEQSEMILQNDYEAILINDENDGEIMTKAKTAYGKLFWPDKLEQLSKKGRHLKFKASKVFGDKKYLFKCSVKPDQSTIEKHSKLSRLLRIMEIEINNHSTLTENFEVSIIHVNVSHNEIIGKRDKRYKITNGIILHEYDFHMLHFKRKQVQKDAEILQISSDEFENDDKVSDSTYAGMPCLSLIQGN